LGVHPEDVLYQVAREEVGSMHALLCNWCWGCAGEGRGGCWRGCRGLPLGGSGGVLGGVGERFCVEGGCQGGRQGGRPVAAVRSGGRGGEVGVGAPWEDGRGGLGVGDENLVTVQRSGVGHMAWFGTVGVPMSWGTGGVSRRSDGGSLGLVG